jgi:hypothetical protein
VGGWARFVVCSWYGPSVRAAGRDLSERVRSRARELAGLNAALIRRAGGINHGCAYRRDVTDDGPAGGRSRKGIGRPAGGSPRARASQQPAHRRRPISTRLPVRRSPIPFLSWSTPFRFARTSLYLYSVHDVTIRGGRSSERQKWIRPGLARAYI